MALQVSGEVPGCWKHSCTAVWDSGGVQLLTQVSLSAARSSRGFYLRICSLSSSSAGGGLELVFWDTAHLPFQTDLCVFIRLYVNIITRVGVIQCMWPGFKMRTAPPREKNRRRLLLSTLENPAA